MKRNITSGYRTQVGFGVEIFSDCDLENIHLATLEVLEKNGLYVQAENALKIFASGGARVDWESHMVKIPPYIVEEAIRSAPKKIVLAGRNPKNDVVLESNRVNFLPFGEGVMVVDPYTGEYRKSTKQDQANACKLVDALDQYDIVEYMVAPQDIDAKVMCLHTYEASVANTSKHIPQSPDNAEQAQILIEMGSKVAGGREKLRERPIISGCACPQSPLSISEGCSDSIIEYAKAGLPMNVLSMAMAGGSSPVSLAGTLVTHNCEVLGGLVLSQLVNKGAPIIYGSSTTVMDLRRATATVGCPELGMLSAAVVKMAQYYLLPCYVAGG